MSFTRSKILFLSIGLVALSIVVTGCNINFFKKTVEDDDSWKDEILWGQECGLDRMSCCTDREPVCAHGQECCTDPNDPDRDYCADECTCGGGGEFCCADEPKCQSDLTCYQGYCTPCGANDQPCCSGDLICRDDLVCYKERCVECGLAGNPCCVDETACYNQEKTDKSRTECYDGVCVYCGSRGKIACLKGTPCNPGHLLNNDFCHECGEYNQPCCNEDSGLGYECSSEKGLVCQLGFCAREQ